MTYAKVEGTEITAVGLPETGILSDGSTVSNYHLLDPEVLEQEGWRSVVDQKPVYDETTEDLVHEGYEFVDNTVRVKYSKQPKPPAPEPLVDPEIARQKFRDAVNAATTLASLKAAILGNPTTDTPGAAPDLGNRP
jgi:hypothetical protein